MLNTFTPMQLLKQELKELENKRLKLNEKILIDTKKLKESKIVLKDISKKHKEYDKEYDQIDSQQQELNRKLNLLMEEEQGNRADVQIQTYEIATTNYEANLIAFHKGNLQSSEQFKEYIPYDKKALNLLQDLENKYIYLKSTRKQTISVKQNKSTLQNQLEQFLKQMRLICKNLQFYAQMKLTEQQNILNQQYAVDILKQSLTECEQIINHKKFLLAQEIVNDFHFRQQ